MRQQSARAVISANSDHGASAMFRKTQAARGAAVLVAVLACSVHGSVQDIEREGNGARVSALDLPQGNKHNPKQKVSEALRGNVRRGTDKKQS
eukprot:6188417-Pleurochrysis_carterae.AAC.1